MGLTSTLNPHGFGADLIANIWWVMFWVAAAVFLIVLGYLIVILRRSAHRAQHPAPPELGASNDKPVVIVAGLTALVLVVVFAFAMRNISLHNAALPPPGEAIEVQVIAHQWWWEIRYPELGAVSANEITIPVGQRVRVIVNAADVIHSFWVPSLQGKMDAIPGQSNFIWLHADQPGVYRGECAEYCGVQHAHMAFMVRAVSEDEFTETIARLRRPAPEPASALLEEGQQVFLGSACVYCHTIRGTPATSNLGPDLTHLASRLTLGAGLLPNTKGHLAGWVVNAQALKPGNKMPPMYLEGDALQALLAYLESLE